MNASPRRLIDDCFLHDKDRLRHDDVLALLGERLSRQSHNPETVDLGASAWNRVAGDAEVTAAPRNIPDFTNAAVDGYAFAAASLGDDETVLEVSCARIQAGTASAVIVAKLEVGTAARIFTGAADAAGRRYLHHAGGCGCRR